MAGLRVGQAFGMFSLPGFGVGSSSPWVPGHPTSMYDLGVNRGKNNRKAFFGTLITGLLTGMIYPQVYCSPKTLF